MFTFVPVPVTLKHEVMKVFLSELPTLPPLNQLLAKYPSLKKRKNSFSLHAIVLNSPKTSPVIVPRYPNKGPAFLISQLKSTLKLLRALNHNATCFTIHTIII